MSSNEESVYNIYISFHIAGVQDFHKSSRTIDSVMRDIFDDDCECVLSADGHSREVVYKIQRPVFYANGEQRNFFHKLDEAFGNLQDFYPHFTHFFNQEERF